MYDAGILQSTEFHQVKTIGVGNIAVGGTGKTPHIEYLIRLLKNDFKISTLSRGYKRKTKGFILSNEFSSCEDIGDEPLQFKSKFSDVQVAVDGNRVRGVQQLIMACSPDVILLDDAFQHRAIKPGLNILLTDFNRLYPFDFFLPSGRLRDAKREVLRADIIIVTKTPFSLTNIELKMIKKDLFLIPSQKLFFSYIKYGKLCYFKDLNKAEKDQNLITIENDLFKFSVLLFSGIANDRNMYIYLKEFANEIQVMRFSDHHFYTAEDLKKIKLNFDSIKSEHKLMVTTEKDMMRLRNSLFSETIDHWPLYILPIEIDFKDKNVEFNQTILNYVRANNANK